MSPSEPGALNADDQTGRYKVVRVPLETVEFNRGYRTVAGARSLEIMLNGLDDEWEIVAAGTTAGDAVILQRRQQ